MFTGLIEEIGTVCKVNKGTEHAQITIKAKKILEDLKIGDSISTNGVCLTVIHFLNDAFTVDVMAETMRKSNMHHLVSGDQVNLERALKLSDRLGGHIVSGHTDGVGTIVDRYQEANAIWIEIQTAPNLLKYIIHKGSIALDGISLTVAALTQEGFKVSIIPHTGNVTTLLNKEKGSAINIECDLFGKYVERFLEFSQVESVEKTLDVDFLKEHGFI